MIPLLTVDQVRRAEQDAINAGTSESDLMLAAGTRIAEQLHLDRGGGDGRALVLSGPGKNGGDGIVIADRLQQLGWESVVWLYKRDGVDGAPVSKGASEGITWVESSTDLEGPLSQCDVVVDAVFGAGGRAELPREVVDVFARVAEERRRRALAVWAVDLPSGIDADSGDADLGALPADVTAMVGFPKLNAYAFPAASLTGEIKRIEIGLPEPAGLDPQTPRLLTLRDARAALPDRRAETHKRRAGTLLVIGGAPNYYGAPRLAAHAGLRAGAGLVSVAAPSSIIPPMASAVPELTFVPLPVAEHATAGDRLASIIREHLPETHALVIGPGLGTDDPVPDFLSILFGVRQTSRRNIGFGSVFDEQESEPFRAKAVLDADALNWLATQERWWEPLAEAELVLTPHPGELARLLDVDRAEVEAQPWSRALEAAQTFQQVVVLKYGHSVVASPDGRLFVAPQAPPSLATAGTGDVLSGVIGSMLAQGLPSVEAAQAGVVLGLAANALAQREVGETGLLASDLIHCLPAALTAIHRDDYLLI